MAILDTVNYLAHAYLSFGIPDVVVGNLISDFVKGKKQLEYPDSIRKGITLHRAIDTFTDTHPVTRRAKSYFRAVYGLYAGALTDVVYDHFLANDPVAFPAGAIPDLPDHNADASGIGRIPPTLAQSFASNIDRSPDRSLLARPLAAFAQQTYRQLATREPLFPERFARMFPFMRDQDWLYHYRYKQGIFNSFAGLARRAAYMPPPQQACELFEAHYADLEDCYREFFPSLRDFAVRTMEDRPIR
jgi:acyl carrier protein phosphodiesterase